MKTLSQHSFTKAGSFILKQARPLEQRLFEYHFKDGPEEAVLAELGRYQNDDGGFGRALEPDFRLQASSPLATTVAMQRIRELSLPPGHPIVQKALLYLISTYDPQKGYWPAVPTEVNQVPHAPWWHFDEAEGKTAPETPANPTAEIAGYLHAYPELIPADFLADRTEFALNHLLSQPDEMGMHDVFCFLRLAAELPEPAQGMFMERLKRAIDKIVTRDPQNWADYGPQPIMFVKSPDSPLAALLEEEIQANLDYTIDTQNEDGSWSPNWSWGDNYPETWDQAKQEWQGILTLENLRTLAAFGRIRSE